MKTKGETINKRRLLENNPKVKTKALRVEIRRVRGLFTKVNSLQLL